MFCCLVTESCLTLCNHMDSSTPDLPVLHYLPQFAKTHVHWVGDTIQPSYPLLPTSPPALNHFPASGSFPISWLFPSDDQSIRPLVSVLPVNIQGWFPLGWTGLISLQSKGLSRVFSKTTVRRHQKVLSHLKSPTLTSVHDYWKNHSFEYTDLCGQRDVSAF